MHSLDKIQSSSLETIENISARDALIHFNTHIFPKIRAKYFSFPVKTKREIKWLFTKKSKEEQRQEELQLYSLFWAEIAKWIFDFVIGDHITDLKRINLFLNVMYLEMETTAYCNAWLDFNNCAKIFENEWSQNKSRIIQESLKLCDKKFWKWVTTITFTEDFLLFENWYWTTIQSKKDFITE